jgi:hypothetical protein
MASSGAWVQIASATASCTGILSWTQLTANGELAAGPNSLRWTATPTAPGYIIQVKILSPDMTSGMVEYTNSPVITSVAPLSTTFKLSITITGGVQQSEIYGDIGL